MKQKLTAILALTVLAGSAHAVTCQNSIPSSNPDDIYEISPDGASVTDTRTGLTWKRCLEGMKWSGKTCTGTPTTMSWAEALDHAKSQGSDWRLPNIKELRSLVEECRTSPAINDTVFSDTPSSYVWSGSPYAGSPGSAWEVSFANGKSSINGRSGEVRVRLVRGGQSFDPLPEAVPGACGAAQGVASTTAPATNLCSAGTASSVTNSSGQWQWSCAGENGGATQACAAPVKQELGLAEGAWQGQALNVHSLPQNNWVITVAETATAASVAALPAGVTMPHGVVKLKLEHGAQGTAAKVVLTYPNALPAGTQYYKYGPTTSDPNPHWYKFDGAAISGNTITLTLTDGGAGDDDLAANSVIEDPGGPVILGGGVPPLVNPVPTLSQWMLALMAGVMLLFGMGQLRRRA